MTLAHVDPQLYAQQLNEKVTALETALAPLHPPQVEVFDSARSHYRQRAEFKIWQEKQVAHYAMYKPGEYKRPFIVEDFPVGLALINDLMPPLLAAINADELLRRRLFQCEFLTTLYGEALITLIYHKALDEQWLTRARVLAESLGIAGIIGRSRGQKLVTHRDWVTEEFHVGGCTYRYQQIETGFTQPNGGICEKMLNWAQVQSTNFGGDLLELYCGNGNFTLPLARNFHRVLATELHKKSVKSAIDNARQNGVDNITLVRMSSEEFVQAADKVRPFRRLRDVDLDSYRFSTVFVDPPRAGLDPHTTALTQRFDKIIYISCNPETLQRDLQTITATHQITALAAFDQFPYTHHLECGAVLQRR